MDGMKWAPKKKPGIFLSLTECASEEFVSFIAAIFREMSLTVAFSAWIVVFTHWALMALENHKKILKISIFI